MTRQRQRCEIRVVVWHTMDEPLSDLTGAFFHSGIDVQLDRRGFVVEEVAISIHPPASGWSPLNVVGEPMPNIGEWTDAQVGAEVRRRLEEFG